MWPGGDARHFASRLFDAEPPFVNIAQSPNGGGGFDPTLVNPVAKEVVTAWRRQPDRLSAARRFSYSWHASRVIAACPSRIG
jgi:hypothetical protein